MRIYIFKKKGNNGFTSKAFKDFKAQEMANYFLNHVLGILIICGANLIGAKLNGVRPEDFGKYPYNTLFYYRSFVAPILAILVLTVSFMTQKNYVKAFIDELKSLYFQNFGCKYK